MLHIIFDHSAKSRFNQFCSISKCADTVHSLDLSLDIGTINSFDIFSSFSIDQRKEFLQNLYCGIKPLFSVSEFKSFWDKNLSTIQILKTNTEPLCIWYGNTPRELCALYFFLHTFQNSTTFYGVEIPMFRFYPNPIIDISGVQTLDDEDFLMLQTKKNKLDLSFIKYASKAWNTLKKDNSFLRIQLNGKIVGVSESFYDEFILTKISLCPQTVASIIDSALQVICGVSDYFIFSRIVAMVQSGLLHSSCKNNLSYKTLISKC